MSDMSKFSGVRSSLLLTREQCRAVDQYAIEELGIPGVVLMENAGRNAADHLERWLRERTPGDSPPGPAAIVCGKGNNGGDGLVIARHLTNRGCQVWIDLVGEASAMAGDAAVNYRTVKKMGIPIYYLNDRDALSGAVARWRDCAVLVEALLGTGFSGQVRDPILTVVSAINALKGPLVVAIDLPCGLDADAGCTGGTVLRADRTITFLANKVGFSQQQAKHYLGEVTVADIGAPLELILGRLGLSPPSAAS